MKNETEQKLSSKKLIRRKYLIAIIVAILFTMSALILSYLNQEQGPDPAMEKAILESLAKTLGKEPNDIVDEDFTKIEFIYISQSSFVRSLDPSVLLIIARNFSDFNLLEKFTNLRILETNFTEFPENKIPDHMKLLAKMGFIDLKNRFFFDLEPLGKLLNLNNIDLNGAPVKNIKPMSNLINLEYLNLNGTSVSDLEPLKKLYKLKRLNINDCNNLKEEQIKDLQKALPNLEIQR